ncbi:Transcriptional regulator, LysR family [Candidatus Hydrogenisulfobacillus filiaventi]|uniref:Transcriptional regulator, LysR family n=1 Tax=Candidatus Hydrogenisulfobacillus filiaventi TaxID=2707344 RepID=A0A6F8ZF51_9FIRM|nr:LysR family transcriptional regulator [Bacillota bacterium]CAB1128498.1 Transcriptional regulator, LysR family [Candidatus Hydrogenisulfobacillus filiaventi]
MSEDIWITFKAVADTGSVSKAARLLNLSPSAVSQQIQRLEGEYRARLLVRTARGVSLTEAGEVLYRYVNRLLRTLEEARQALRDESGSTRPAVTIGANPTLAEYVLPDILPEVAQRQRLRVTLVVGNSRAIFQHALHGAVDLGLTSFAFSHGQIVSEALCEDRPQVLVGRGHAWAGREEVSLDEFLNQPLILREPGSGTRMALERALERAGYGSHRLSVRFTLGSTPAIKALAAAGLGAAVLSPLVLLPSDRQRLHAVRVAGLDLSRQFYAVHRRDLGDALIPGLVAAVRAAARARKARFLEPSLPGLSASDTIGGS